MDIRSFFGPAAGTKKQKDGKNASKVSQTSVKDSKSKTRRNSGHSDHSKKKETRSCDRKRKKNGVSDAETEEDEIVPKVEKKKKRVQRVIDSDSDEEPIPKSKKKKKEAVVFIQDSDEDEPKVKRSTSLTSFVKITPPKPKTKEKTPEKKTIISAADFFGVVSVKRIEKKAVEKRKMSLEDMEIHDDDDFAKTLSQLDKQSNKKVKKDESSEKLVGNGNTPSLSSKLAGKVKAFVEETPEKPSKKEEIQKLSPLKRPSPKKSPIKHELTITPNKKSPKKSASDSVTPVQKKTSPNKTSPNELSDTPALERRTSYRSYLTREGPRALGSKQLPEGADNCLEDLTFVITGVLESLERDEAKSFVEKYGGKVTTSISKKTSYIVIGRDAGESKLAKATQFKTRQIDEDGLLELVKTRPGKKSKYLIKAEQEHRKESSGVKDKMTTLKKKLSDSFSQEKKTDLNSNSIKSSKTEDKSSIPESPIHSKSPLKSSSQSEEDCLLWVDKYKPTNTSKIIGQQGEKSNAKKLIHWLKSWHRNRAAGTKPAGRFFGGSGKDDGGGFKAALLSGPPGIGKTTTATLVCQEVGFSYVELNASDTRSKRNLKEVVAESLNNTTLVDYMSSSHTSTEGHHHCVIMDEVDGMAGNEDRGGLQELVALIKSSKIPIICICNDRNSMKMRTLSNHCFDLRFSKPRLEQIKGAMMSLAFKEGLTIPAPALNEIILGANQDIRQIIHNMCVWSATDKNLTYEQAKSDSAKARKDTKLGPFDVCRKVFSSEESSKLTLMDKSDLFFHDYSLAPLFVQENYIHVNPFSTRGSTNKHLSLLARTADSICDGDLTDKLIRSGGHWNLLPAQAMFASVIPGEYMRGSLPQMVQFPSWLGKNSSRTKHDRILQELRSHMCLKTSGNKISLNLDYLPAMRYSMTEPLVQHGGDGVSDVINMMDNYDIMKDDFDNILEVSKYPNSRDPLSKLDTKTKAAFTRMYNKAVHVMPYSSGVVMKKKRGKAVADDEDGLEEDPTLAADSDDDYEDIEMDSMIKMKKKPISKVKETTSQSKGGKGQTKGKGETKAKGKGKGKGKGKS